MAHTTPAIPGRETQLAELAAVVGLHTEEVYHEAPREPAPPLVVVYGGVSTGKSRCVRHVLCAAADHFALIDGTGVMSTREFYREVLGQLHSNSRRRRPRRDGSTTDGVVELDDQDDDVTITDAPMLPVEAEPETKKSVRHAHSRERRGGRKRRVDAERKGSEVEDASGSDSDEEDDASDESTDDEDTQSRRTKPKTTRAIGNARNGAIGNKDDPIEGEDPAHGSLNFLSFVKAVRGYMNTALPEGGAAIGPKPSVVIALDHVERLLERGFGKLLTCLLTVNDQLDYLHIFDANGAPWRLCVVLVARAVSLNLDLFLHGAHPAFIHFPPYTKEEVAMIVTHNLLGAADSSIAQDDSRERAAWLRKWLVSLYDLLPHCHHDWLEFQHVVVQMLPSFYEFFDLVSIYDHAPLPQFDDLPDKNREATADGTNRSWVQLQKASRDRIASLEKSRRRHLFGYDNVARGTATATSFSVASTTAETVSVSSGDPVAFIASSKLSRSCLLLLLASYLASFTPHEADAHFVSSSGGLKRKRRIHRGANALGGANGTSSDAHGGGGARKKSSAAAARKAMNQQLIGPKIFELPRLLAIYQSLQIESDALMDELAASDDSGESTRMASARSTRTRADIFSHLSLLVRLRLLQRASPSSDFDQPLFRCIADTRLVHEIARRLQFPLDAYLNTRG